MGGGNPEHGITATPPRPRAPGPPTRVRYLVLAAVCSLAVLTYVQRQGFVAGTPFIKQDLGLDDEDMGYLASVWLVAYGLFQVPTGLLGDRLGGRRVLTLLVFVWSLLSGAVALAVFLPVATRLSFVFLLVLRFLFGMFQAGGFPVLARVLADWMPARQRGFAQGMSWTFSRLGGFVAPLLVLWLIGVFDGWAIPLALIAGLGLVWSAFFWHWFRNLPEEMAGVNDAERALIESGRPLVVASAGPLPWTRFLGSRSVWGLCLMYGFVGFAGNFITSLLPLYLRDHRHLDVQTTAWLSGLPLAFGIVSCLLGGVVSDGLIRITGSRRWGRRLVGSTVLMLAAVATLSPLWADEVWLLGLAFSAWFFFNDASIGPAWASCADVGEHHAGTLSGAMNMTGAFFGAAGMAFAGTLLKKGAYPTVFIVFACSYALAALCWLAVDVTRPLVPRVPQS
jgi:ACS family glucarate transporter-like MFS transporter